MTASLRAFPLHAAFPSAPEPALRFESVRKTFRPRGGPETLALDGVTLEVAAGRIVGVVGRSGAGKSTLLHLAAGRVPPTAGHVRVDAGAAILLGAQGGVRPARTAFDAVRRAAERAGARSGAIDRRATQLLTLVGLAEDAGRAPAALSGGRAQRLRIAQALAARPCMLLCDEPAAGLDPETAREILAALGRVNAELGVTVLLASHDLAAVATIAHRIAVLEQGRIVEEGSAADMVVRPAHPVTRGFAAAAPAAALPPFLAAKLRPQAALGGRALLRLTFTGAAATRPVLTRVARDLGFDLGIVAGALGAVGGEPYGVLIVAAPADEPYYTAAVERLEDSGLGVEVLGYVA